MTLPDAYTTVDDLIDYWRALSNVELDRATILLSEAADLINGQPGAETFTTSTCRWVSLKMVKRAMLNGDGVRQMSQAMDGMSVQQSYVNPAGDMYLTRAEANRLAGRTGPAAFTLIPTSNAAVPPQVWNRQQDCH